MKLIPTSNIVFFLQITTIDDSIDNDPNYVEPALDIDTEKEDDADADDDDGDEVEQDDEFDDHEHDLDDDVGGAS